MITVQSLKKLKITLAGFGAFFFIVSCADQGKVSPRENSVPLQNEEKTTTVNETFKTLDYYSEYHANQHRLAKSVEIENDLSLAYDDSFSGNIKVTQVSEMQNALALNGKYKVTKILAEISLEGDAKKLSFPKTSFELSSSNPCFGGQSFSGDEAEFKKSVEASRLSFDGFFVKCVEKENSEFWLKKTSGSCETLPEIIKKSQFACKRHCQKVAQDKSDSCNLSGKPKHLILGSGSN